MGLIKEPLDIDFTVDPRPLTDAEKNSISEYIRNYKMDQASKNQVHASKNKVNAGKRTLAHHR